MKDNIPGFMGYYVSKTGSVYSRYVRGSRGKLSNEFTPLIPKKRPKYYSVSLYRDGKSTKIFVHRLVAMTYIPNPKNKPCVCHKDNDRTNNRVENLYWGTYKENTQQCIQDGRFKPGGRDILDEFSINCLLYEYNLGKPRSILKKEIWDF